MVSVNPAPAAIVALLTVCMLMLGFSWSIPSLWALHVLGVTYMSFFHVLRDYAFARSLSVVAQCIIIFLLHASAPGSLLPGVEVSQTSPGLETFEYKAAMLSNALLSAARLPNSREKSTGGRKIVYSSGVALSLLVSVIADISGLQLVGVELGRYAVAITCSTICLLCASCKTRARIMPTLIVPKKSLERVVKRQDGNSFDLGVEAVSLLCWPGLLVTVWFSRRLAHGTLGALGQAFVFLTPAYLFLTALIAHDLLHNATVSFAIFVSLSYALAFMGIPWYYKDIFLLNHALACSVLTSSICVHAYSLFATRYFSRAGLSSLISGLVATYAVATFTVNLFRNLADVCLGMNLTCPWLDAYLYHEARFLGLEVPDLLRVGRGMPLVPSLLWGICTPLGSWIFSVVMLCRGDCVEGVHISFDEPLPPAGLI